MSISIGEDGLTVQAFAVEVIIYNSSSLTTLFVSKADSTGYLLLAKHPKEKRSLLKRISRTFLQYLVEKYQKPQKRLLLSLFARSQNQYLFPGSIENHQKHVLSDRGLIKWWCQIFDEIIQQYPVEPLQGPTKKEEQQESSISAKAYLRVPGCDSYETRSFLPSNAKYDNKKPQRWHSSEDPLREIASSPSLPERCLIPRFPDDPKARYLDSLDEELSENAFGELESPLQYQFSGKWRSVRSLEQFWETMAFRQECSSGRLVGFLWAVFSPPRLDVNERNTGGEHDRLKVPQDSGEEAVTTNGKNAEHPYDETPLPDRSQINGAQQVLLTAPHVPSLDTSANPVLANSAHPYQERINIATDPGDETPNKENQEPSPISSIPAAQPSQDWYPKIGSFLLSLDYATLPLAKQSTKAWIDQVDALVPSTHYHSFDIVGEQAEESEAPDMRDAGESTNNEKKRTAEAVNPAAAAIPIGLVRKKVKTGLKVNDLSK